MAGNVVVDCVSVGDVLDLLVASVNVYRFMVDNGVTRAAT